MYFVYAIKSAVKNYIYVGLTNDLSRRISQHNAGSTRTTRAYRPFTLLHFEELPDRPAACQREKYLKSGVGKEFLKLKRDLI
jgi:putative endonuclease